MKMKVATFEINDYLGHAFTCDCGKQHTTRLEHVRVCDLRKVHNSMNWRQLC